MAKREPVSVTVNAEPDLVAKNPGPLLLANPILENMHIREAVNRHCREDPRREVPLGDVIFALAANRLCSPEPLLHVAEWAEHCGAEFFPGTPAETLNDDRLARALDAVFANRWNILADVALHVSEKFDISLAKLHYDPTSFHFTGEYDESSEDPSLLPGPAPFKIEVGRHARPGDDIKEAQVGVNLANDDKGPVPVFFHSADGSANGHIAVAKNLQHLLKYLKPKRLLSITDRGCFNTEHAVRMVRRHNFHFISSLTWTKELAELYDRKQPELREASFLSMRERAKRERGAPEDTWNRYCIGEVPYKITWERKPEDHQKASLKQGERTIKESIRTRLIFVHSTADMKVCRKTRAKNTDKIQQGLTKLQRSVENGYCKDFSAVEKKIVGLYGKKQAQNYFSYQVRELTKKELRSLPPRRRGQRKPTLKFSFQYHADLAEKDSKYDGLYAICTSLPKKRHTTDEVFTTFKQQHHIETAHHQWKAPLHLRPLFLKKPSRIESLIFVQFLALMAFYLIQRLYRAAKGQSCRTTAETLIKRFALTAIAVRYHNDTVSVIPLPSKGTQAEILQALHFPQLEDQIRRTITRPTDTD